MKKICLNMIVKNEALIIEDCLKALQDVVCSYVICDTGSTDQTIKIIRDFFQTKNIPGEIHQFEFVNFGYARNKALQFAKNSSLEFDYILFCDADMEMVIEDSAVFAALDKPVYLVEQRAAIDYWNVRLLRRDIQANYVGVTHEYLNFEEDKTKLNGAYFIDHACGSNRADKFIRDAKLLEDALKQEPQNVRYWFYLAQSWRDANEIEKALECYEKRASMGGWIEEVWYSKFQIAKLLARSKAPESAVVQAFLEAYEFRPQRVESLVELAIYYRLMSPSKSALSYLYSKAAVGIEKTNDVLFVDSSCYTWRADDELSISAYWIGAYAESAESAYRMLKSSHLPQHQVLRVLDNLCHSLIKLKQPRKALPDHEVTLVVTSCGRLDLLYRSIASFLRYNSFPIKSLILIEDSGQPEAAIDLQKFKNVVEKMFSEVEIICNNVNLGQVDSIDLAYSKVKTPYIFHMEDDWEFFKSGFIEESLKILKTHPWILTVWLRSYEDTNGHPIDKVSGFQFNLMALGYAKHWHGFTWNPGLRRLKDYQRIISFRKNAPGEALASELYMKLGFRCAITKDERGYVKHLGWGRSTGAIPGTKKG